MKVAEMELAVCSSFGFNQKIADKYNIPRIGGFPW